MKIIKYIHAIAIGAIILVGTQSCFQDLGQDIPFNYPQGSPDPTGAYNPQKLVMPFENNVYDMGTYQFQNSVFGDYSFAEGINGKAFQGGGESYILVNNHPAINYLLKDTIANLGSFTVSFWMNTSRNTGATGMFSISNKTRYWGNLDVFLENTSSETQALFHVHITNERTGTLKENTFKAPIDNVFKNWAHLVFVYNGKTSTFMAYHNGVLVKEEVLPDFGEIQFKNVGPIVIGALQFQTTPSLTTAAGKQSWATWFPGKLDQLLFYNKALSASEVKQLYDAKQ